MPSPVAFCVIAALSSPGGAEQGLALSTRGSLPRSSSGAAAQLCGPAGGDFHVRGPTCELRMTPRFHGSQRPRAEEDWASLAAGWPWAFLIEPFLRPQPAPRFHAEDTAPHPARSPPSAEKLTPNRTNNKYSRGGPCGVVAGAGEASGDTGDGRASPSRCLWVEEAAPREELCRHSGWRLRRSWEAPGQVRRLGQEEGRGWGQGRPQTCPRGGLGTQAPILR